MDSFAIRYHMKEDHCGAAGFNKKRTKWVFIHGLDYITKANQFIPVTTITPTNVIAIPTDIRPIIDIISKTHTTQASSYTPTTKNTPLTRYHAN